MEDRQEGGDAWGAVAEWYHAFFTGMVLSAVTRRSTADAAELVFQVFRRQQRTLFLPGLRKLGLAGLPHAVAAAQYHYLSNAIGGVQVEYMPESDRKAWVRYAPPRWVWQGTAICAVPGEVSKAVLRGWHAHNGVALGNRRLGFVCTKQTVEGQDGLEGYYYEHDHDLTPEERLRFARDEEAPDFDAARAPVLPSATWPEARLRKARRNYAIAYMRTAIPAAIQVFGPEEAVALLGLTGRLIGMQFYAQTAVGLGLAPGDGDFRRFMLALAAAQDDEAAADGADGVRQGSWRVMRGVADLHPAAFACWNGLLEGALAAHDRWLELRVEGRLDLGDPAFVWRIGPRRRVMKNKL
jgi:hypothetical protein